MNKCTVRSALSQVNEYKRETQHLMLNYKTNFFLTAIKDIHINDFYGNIFYVQYVQFIFNKLPSAQS